MGANRQQGWALFLFVIGFTFMPAGFFALGPLFIIAGAICLVISLAWFVRLKPLEHRVDGDVEVSGSTGIPPRKKAS